MRLAFQILISLYILFKFGISGILWVIILNLAVIGLFALIDSGIKKSLDGEQD